MELSITQYGLIMSAILFFLTAQALFVYYLDTRIKQAPRVKMEKKLSKQYGITFRVNGEEHSFPLLDFSKTGISFYLRELPKNMVLSKSVTVCFENAEFTPVEVDSELIYMKSLDNGTIRIGLKFTNPLTNHIWNGTMKSQKLSLVSPLSEAA